MVFSVILILAGLVFSPLSTADAHPEVVSLYVGHSESLLALGYGKSLKGVSQSDDPGLFPDLPRIPPRFDPESIIALSPDVVLLRPMIEQINQRAVETLRRSGIRVLSLDPPSWDGVEEYIMSLSSMMGDDGTPLVDDFRFSIDRLKSAISKGKTGPKKIYYLETGEGGIRTCSPTSWAAGLLSLAGFENGAKDADPIREGSPLATYGLERLLALSSRGLDLYIVQVGTMNDVNERDLMGRGWIKALQGVKIVFVQEKDISRPSLLRFEETVRQLSDMDERDFVN